MNPTEQPRCVYCGSTLDLVADRDNEDVWYCRACLDKHLRHGEQIADRGEAEPPFDG